MITRRFWRVGVLRFAAPLLMVSAVSGIGLTAPAASSQEAGPPSFDAAAQASGAYVQYGIPGFLVVDYYVDGGGPVATSVMDSLGKSQALASLPYPGETATTVPGAVAALTGVPAPPYPFYATASHPTRPEHKVADPAGAYALAAVAREDGVGGEARFGAPPSDAARSGAQAATEIKVTKEAVTSTATSLTQGIALGPLSVATVRSKSVTTYPFRAEKPSTTTELTLEGGKAGDVSFSFDPDGLRVGAAVVPAKPQDGVAALNQALAPAGLSVRFVEPTEVTGGAAAGLFEVVGTTEMPGAGKAILRMRFGGASSSVAVGSGAGSPSLLDTPATTVESPETAAGSGSTVADPSSSAVAAPVADAASGTDAGTASGGFAAAPSGSADQPLPSPAIPAASSPEPPPLPQEASAPAGGDQALMAEPIVSPKQFGGVTAASVVLIAAAALALGALVIRAGLRRLV